MSTLNQCIYSWICTICHKQAQFVQWYHKRTIYFIAKKGGLTTGGPPPFLFWGFQPSQIYPPLENSSGYVQVLFIWDYGTWEEVHKLTLADAQAGDWIKYSVAISATLLSLGTFGITRGAFIADLVTCTPRLVVSGFRMERQLLRMVQLMNTFGVVLTFWVILLYLVTLIQKKIMVALYTLLIFALPDNNIFNWMYNFHIVCQ